MSTQNTQNVEHQNKSSWIDNWVSSADATVAKMEDPETSFIERLSMGKPHCVYANQGLAHSAKFFRNLFKN